MLLRTANAVNLRHPNPVKDTCQVCVCLSALLIADMLKTRFQRSLESSIVQLFCHRMHSHVVTEEGNLGIQIPNMYLDTEVAHTEEISKNVYVELFIYTDLHIWLKNLIIYYKSYK